MSQIALAFAAALLAAGTAFAGKNTSFSVDSKGKKIQLDLLHRCAAPDGRKVLFSDKSYPDGDYIESLLDVGAEKFVLTKRVFTANKKGAPKGHMITYSTKDGKVSFALDFSQPKPSEEVLIGALLTQNGIKTSVACK